MPTATSTPDAPATDTIDVEIHDCGHVDADGISLACDLATLCPACFTGHDCRSCDAELARCAD